MLSAWRALAITLGAMVLVLSGGFGIQASMLHTNWRIDLGTLPDWLAGLGTIAAFITLIFVARQWKASETDRQALETERRAVDTERRALAAAREAERHDFEASQARLIIVEQEPHVDHSWGGSNPPPPSRRNARIVNRSSAPVFHLRIEQEPREFAAEVTVLEILRQGRGAPDGPVFSPGESTERLLVAGNSGDTPSTEYVAFIFTDARGVQWRRVGSGQPVRLLDAN